MPNPNALKGYRAELELVLKAKAAGCHAQRSPASKGTYDVEVVPASGIHYLVNIKVNDWAPPHERAALLARTGPYDEAVLARRSTGGPWHYRGVREDGTMSEIVDKAPWL